jgi:excisionase family DNA binding protein
MLKSSEMARLLGVAKNTLLELANSGAVPAIKLPSGQYRFNPDEVIGALRHPAEAQRDEG